MSKEKKIILHCTVCGATIERDKLFKRVACFPCKKARLALAARGRYELKKKKPRPPKSRIDVKPPNRPVAA